MRPTQAEIEAPYAAAWLARRCSCGSADIVAVAPGRDPEYAVGRRPDGTQDKRLAPIMVCRGAPDVALCMDCYQRRLRR
jgi:hypothetical protein